MQQTMPYTDWSAGEPKLHCADPSFEFLMRKYLIMLLCKNPFLTKLTESGNEKGRWIVRWEYRKWKKRSGDAPGCDGDWTQIISRGLNSPLNEKMLEIHKTVQYPQFNMCKTVFGTICIACMARSKSENMTMLQVNLYDRCCFYEKFS